MPASTPWWSTPSIAAPRPGRRPTLGLAAAIVASVLSGVAMADPPPPASPSPRASPQGWRGQVPFQQPRYMPAPQPYMVYAVPYGINHGTCDRNLLAKELMGSLTSAEIAPAKASMNSAGNAETPKLATAATTAPTTTMPAATILVGSPIARSMDDVDQSCVSRVLEYAPDHSAVQWYGATGTGYAVTPLHTFERDGRYCREYQTTAVIGGQDKRVYGTACRMPDGGWQTVS